MVAGSESRLACAFWRRGAVPAALAFCAFLLPAALPDVPTIGEFVPGYEASGFFGVGAPKNIPAEIVSTLNREINVGLADPKIRERITDLGGVPMPMTPAEFGKFFGDESEKWAKTIRGANIRPRARRLTRCSEAMSRR